MLFGYGFKAAYAAGQKYLKVFCVVSSFKAAYAAGQQLGWLLC